MSVSKTKNHTPSPVQSARGRSKKPRTFSHLASASLVALTLASTACTEFHLSTGNLQIAPDPARPGDAVVVSFILNMVPSQSHTITVLIDDIEYKSETREGRPAVPVTIELGDAAGLIGAYGTGPHIMRVRIRAHDDNESAHTRPVEFALEESTS